MLEYSVTPAGRNILIDKAEFVMQTDPLELLRVMRSSGPLSIDDINVIIGDPHTASIVVSSLTKMRLIEINDTEAPASSNPAYRRMYRRQHYSRSKRH